MAAINSNWKMQAVNKSEVISDLLEVGLAYCVRIAEWAIIICLLYALFMTIPGMKRVIDPLVSNIVIGIQLFSLDIAGLGLIGIEKNLRDGGQIQLAKRTKTIMILLIGITLVTSLSFSISDIFPSVSSYTDGVNTFLIIFRIVVSVIFKMFMGTVRANNFDISAVPSTEKLEEKLTTERKKIQQELEEKLACERLVLEEKLASLLAKIEGLQQQKTPDLLPEKRAKITVKLPELEEEEAASDGRVYAKYTPLEAITNFDFLRKKSITGTMIKTAIKKGELKSRDGKISESALRQWARGK